MQTVAYNACFGGFGIDHSAIRWVREHRDELEEAYGEAAVEELAERTLPGEYYRDGSGPKPEHRGYVHGTYLSRDNELLCDLILGDGPAGDYDGRISGRHADLRVATVPDGIDWTIDEYDGRETVEEVSRTFR